MLPSHNVTFFHNYCTIDSTTMFTAYPQHIHTVFVYNYTTQYTRFAVYICLPFHNVIFFLNHCIIHSTTVFTAYPQHMHTVLFTITLPSRLTLLFTYVILFTMWYFSTMTAQFTLQQCLQHILNIYIRYCLQLHYPVYWLCCLYMLPLHNVTFFHNDCTIHSTTVFTAYPQHMHTVLFTITLPSRLTLLFTYVILFTMWYFSTMTAQFTLQQCLQHILNIYIRYCLQLHYPVYCLCYYICYTFHNMIFFHNYCTIDSTTMSTAYPQHIHTILFTITLPSILTLLFIYASFTQCDIFSQLLHNWLYNNVYSISSTYTCGTVYNYTTQYAEFAVYICFPFHNVIFFHNYRTIHSTKMSIAYP